MRERRRVSVEQRFWAKVDKRGPDECWLWTASGRNDYGQFWLNDTMVYAHRMAYELLVGPIPVGLFLDHLCRVPRCVNPDHLEPVTNQENIRRGEAGHHMRAVALARTHCVNGHAYDSANTMYDFEGYRRCRICYLAGRRRSYVKRSNRDNSVHGGVLRHD